MQKHLYLSKPQDARNTASSKKDVMGACTGNSSQPLLSPKCSLDVLCVTSCCHGNEPLCKHSGGDVHEKEGGSSYRPANTRAGSIPPSVTAMSEQPGSACHWCGVLSSHFSIILYPLNMGSLGKTPLGSPHEQGKTLHVAKYVTSKDSSCMTSFNHKTIKLDPF